MKKIDTLIDVKGLKCPLPLIKTRKAIMKAKKGNLIMVEGTDSGSFDEILATLDSLNIECIESDNSGTVWYINFKI